MIKKQVQNLLVKKQCGFTKEGGTQDLLFITKQSKQWMLDREHVCSIELEKGFVKKEKHEL